MRLEASGLVCLRALHDGVEPNVTRDSSATVRAVGPVCGVLRRRGIEPVTLAELIGVEPYAAG